MNCCTITGCDRKAEATNLCDMHYRRFRKGQPMDAPVRRPNPFWSDAEKATLRRVYPEGGIAAALEALPGRTEKAIYRMACTLGIECLTQYGGNGCGRGRNGGSINRIAHPFNAWKHSAAPANLVARLAA